MSCALVIPGPEAAASFPEWFTAAEIADMALPGLPRTKRAIQDVANREGWAQATDMDGDPLSRPRRARGGGVEYHMSLLPEAARTRLLSRFAPPPAPATKPVETASGRESVWARYDRLPATMKAEAKARLEVIQRVERLMRAGLNKTRACEEITAQARREARATGQRSFSVSTLNAWFARINGVSTADRLAYLAPDYVGRTATAPCSDEAWLLFRSEYLTNSQQSAAAAHAKVVEIGQDQGWSVPSSKTLLNRIHREVDPITLVYLREGEPGLERKFPTPRRDVSDLTVLQAVNVDGHEVDVMVEWADGTVGRPMMIGIQDLYSRRMLVTLIGRSESTDLIRRAFAQLFRDHGIPEHVIFDNGRAFASKWLTGGNPTRYRFTIRPEDPIGLLGQLGCQVHFTNPYSGRSKPIERGFRDFCDGLARSAVFKGAYTGNSVANKPADYGERAVPYAEFAQELAFYVRLHNGRPGRRTQMARGLLSFDQVWAESLERGALVKRATAEQLRLALLAAEGVTVRRQTAQIHMGGNIYFNEALWRHEGEKVIVRFDPEDLHAPVHVYRLDNVYICQADCVEAVGFLNAEAAKEIGRRKARLLKTARKLAKEQDLLKAAEVAAYRPEPEDLVETEPSNVVAPVFGALALAIQPERAAQQEELTDAQIFEFHARAIEELRSSEE